MHQTPVHTNGRHTGSITPFLNSNICISTDRSMLPSRNKPIQFKINSALSGHQRLFFFMRIKSVITSKDTVDYFNYWHDFASKHLYGIEINDEIARVAKMNMIVHDDGHTNVISFDALDSIDKMHDHNRGFEAGKFDLILTNPPFGSTITKAEKPYLANYELGKTKDAKGKYKDRPRQSSEILFIERIWEFLKPGTGKAAIVLPDGVLTNSSAQYVRDFILEKFQLLAVVSLPQCAFAHFGAGVKTSIIFVRKRKADEKPDENEAIFMAAPALIGYDATGRKTDSQLDEIIQKYEEFQKDATPFFA